MKKTDLKLVTVYDAEENCYSPLGHNLTEEKAVEVAEAHLRRFSVFIVNQQSRHRTRDTDHCENCDTEVASRDRGR